MKNDGRLTAMAMGTFSVSRVKRDWMQLSTAQMPQHISGEELAALFDYGYFVRFVDESFRRVGLV
jgi:hypothetical protein